MSILNKCYIYFRFSEISACRQVCIQFQSLPIWIHKLLGHGCDHIVVGFTTIYAICSNPVDAEVYSIQNYMIKFDSDFRQVGGFPRWRQFP